MNATESSRATRGLDDAVATRPGEKYLFRLYVAGATARSHQAVLRVRQLCEAELKGKYDLEVIDVYQQPELTRDDQIVATPTLVKVRPLPMRRAIGNLANAADLFVGLDVVGIDR